MYQFGRDLFDDSGAVKDASASAATHSALVRWYAAGCVHGGRCARFSCGPLSKTYLMTIIFLEKISPLAEVRCTYQQQHLPQAMPLFL